MNQKQTKLIEQAATVETDGEGWRKRMEEWLDEQSLLPPVRWIGVGPGTRAATEADYPQ